MFGTVLVLVGVRGSGKTTGCRALEALGVHRIRPSTTRPRRGPDDNEYDFVAADAWDTCDMAWRISVGPHQYGVSKAEMARCAEWPLSCCVFYPAALDKLTTYAQRCATLEFITVGVDTVKSLKERAERVAGERPCDGEEEFIAQLEVVRDCDVVLRGDERTIGDALAAIASLVVRRGVLHREALVSLITAGSLVTGAKLENVQPASYDLRLSKKFWRGGIRVVPQDGVIGIQPYSYVIVQARENARLPKFVAGRFDLCVSLFFRGVILSNGPQVDPGYAGALFCLLYNSSDKEVAMKVGEHFATIEFTGLAHVTAGYHQRYQLKERMIDFMRGETVNSPGSRLLERIDEVKQYAKARASAQLRVLLVIFGVLVAISVALLAFAGNRAIAFHEQVRDLEGRAAAARRDLDEACEVRQRARSGNSPAGDAGTN
jgi:deoxycytidine triphosphate deaminase